MNAARIAGVLLLVASVLALVFGGFSYTQDTQAAKLGPIELTVSEHKTVNFPIWAGIAGIVIGGALVLYGSGKRK